MPIKTTIEAKITGLKNKAIPELQKEYENLFNSQKATSDNKIYLVRRIAYRLQELEYGSARSPEAGDSSLAHHCSGLSEKAQNRLKDFIKLYDPINNKAIRPKISIETQAMKKNHIRDRRLPIPGSVIIKEYKGKDIQVKVLEIGFEYNGKIYKNLTAIAKEITGSHWNGYLFFNL